MILISNYPAEYTERLTQDKFFLMVQCLKCQCCWKPFRNETERKYLWNDEIGGYSLRCPGCGEQITVTRTL